MAPPKFADITKATKDLFSDDFNAGKVQLTLKSKATNGVNLKVKGTKSNAKGNVSGSLESTYTNAGGISFKEVWSTQNEVTTEVSMKNALVKGTKLVGEAKFSPTAGFKGQTIKCDYGANNFFINTKLVDLKALTAGGVFSFDKFLVGAEGSFNDKGFKGYSAAVSYVDSDIVISSSVNSGNSVEGSIFHSPTSDIDAGVRFSYNRGSNDTTFELGGSYALDSATSLKTAINKDMSIALAYTQTLRKGVTLGLSADVKAAQLSEDSHSLGLTLELSN
jgi:voltage-dependent anion channel protein 2